MSAYDLLRQATLFAGLDHEELEFLSRCLGRRTFAKGMILFHKGSPGQALYLIETGKVRIFVLSESGQDMTLNLLGPGETFGELALLDGAPRSAGAIAIERTVTFTLSRDEFLRQLDASPRMARNVLAMVASRLRRITVHVESLAFLDVPGRVATVLLELAERYGLQRPDGIQIELRLTQSELATWVAASREMVNKVMGTYRDQGLVAFDGQVIIILDPHGLRQRITY